jgi:hypothetical protein
VAGIVTQVLSDIESEGRLRLQFGRSASEMLELAAGTD